MVSLERYFFPYWFSGFYNERFLSKFDLCRLSIVQPRGYDLKLSRRRTMKIASMLRLMDSSIDWKLWVGWHAWLKSTRFKHTERFGTFSFYYKSDNLQYNTLVRWFAGMNDSLTKHLMLQAFFFIISHRLRALKTFYFYICKFIKNKKINWK